MSLARAALLGGLGFGVGGFLAGALGDLLLAGLVLMGALGGAALALVPGARAPWPRAAVAGALGAGLGFAGAIFTLVALWEPAAGTDAFVGGVGGLVLGGALGAGAAGRAAAGRLALAGAVGFALGFGLLAAWQTPAGGTCCTLAQSLVLGARTGLATAIGGAVLGAAWPGARAKA